MLQLPRCSVRIFASSLLGVLTLSSWSWAQEFTVRRASDDSVAYTGELSAEMTDVSTSMPVKLANFSELVEPGEYYVDVPDVGRSVSFRIGADVYDGELATLMLGYYGWRSGIDVAFDFHGVHYEHAAAHLDDALLDYVDDQTGVRKDGTGGWYDAGDYGKYLPTAAVSVNTMLAAWELFSDRLQHLELPFIPEHGGELPDYLDELKWEVDWVLKMAYDDGSGRVHHKINSPRFPGFVMPADDPTMRYFSNFSTAATGEFVATLAKAARAFAPYDDVTGGYSETLLAAAALAYTYLQENPEDVRYDSSVLSAGEYQKGGSDDRLWAAAEYWETTGDPAALTDLETRLAALERIVPNFDWDQTRNFGVLTYLLSKREGRDPELVASLTDMLQRVADGLVAGHANSGYGRDFDMYYWGTNGVVARTCLLLQAANALTPNPAYLDVCADQIAYLYGRNQYNRSQVTGAGIAPPLNPHHRPSGADDVELPYPGLLVGGGEDATGWLDLQASFSTNEVAINWNAALVFALAGFIQGEGSTNPLGRGPVEPADCGVRVSSVGYVPERSKVATIQTECELPNAFQCEQDEQTLSGDTGGPLVLIDDLEDEDLLISSEQGRQGTWFVFDDGSGGMRSEPTLEAAGREGSDTAICIRGGGFTSWGGGLGFPLSEQGTTRQPYDASGYTGIRFWARGTATPFRTMLVDNYSEPLGGVCNTCNDHFQASFTPSEEWQEFRFTWKELKQLGFGDPQPNICAAGMYAVQFQWLANTDFELCIDDVAFTTAEGTPDPSSDDLSPAGGGCSCRAAGAPSSTSGATLLLAALTGLVLRLRRRRA